MGRFQRLVCFLGGELMKLWWLSVCILIFLDLLEFCWAICFGPFLHFSKMLGARTCFCLSPCKNVML